MTTDTVIVGGGLTGILCALRMTQKQSDDVVVSQSGERLLFRDDLSSRGSIHLLDSHETLGGRLFCYKFERYTQADLETYKRHLYLFLTEDEKNFLETWVHEKMNARPFSTIRPKNYFIKKEFLNAEHILLTNSDFLTRREADVLKELVNFHKHENFELNQGKVLRELDLFKSLNKSSQDSLIAILECTLGKHVSTSPMSILCPKLQSVFSKQPVCDDPFFLRAYEIELALQKILENRNVQMHFKCTVNSIHALDDHYELFVVDENDVNNSKINCATILLTIPPYNMRTIIAKENFSNELARFVAKVQPTSLVCLEIPAFQNKLSDTFQNQFHALDKLYFPIEGVQAHVTSDERLIFSVELDYETSLQAPAVRDALTCARRAARRILKTEFADEMKKGSFIRKMEPFEHVILLSIAQNLPDHIQIEQLSELSDPKLGLKHVFVAGDYFYSLGDTVWKRIVKSVGQIPLIPFSG